MLDFDALKSAVSSRPKTAAAPGLLDGRFVRDLLTTQLRHLTAALHADHKLTPCLGVILVGDDPASHLYVRNKINLSKRVGIRSVQTHLPASVTQDHLLYALHRLNHDPQVHGILVQMPLPPHLDVDEVILSLDPLKDVDGFHPVNLGGLLLGRATLEPCTPRGIMTLCRAYDVPLAGQRAVVIGRSMNVGRPMAQMLTRADATVTVCHRHTRDLEDHVRQADLLVVAAGVPGLVPGPWIKPSAVVIDVGITRMPDGSLCGDVGFDQALPRARLITPVPGGVGPMTVATLMENTVRALCAQHQITLTPPHLAESPS